MFFSNPDPPAVSKVLNGDPEVARITNGWAAWVADPRHFQITFLTLFIAVGVWKFGFDIQPMNAAAAAATALATQVFFGRLSGVPRFDPRSPIISALSLCLLLRTDSVQLMAMAAAVAIASKFLVRWNGKHIFNPTNIAIVTLIVSTPSAWVSSGQWGSEAWIAFLLVALGGLVSYRAMRSDIALAVLGFHATVLFGRALWLGDPMSIPIHQMQNGTLLVFAFFMISDPRTTPDARAARVVYALFVVLLAAWVQFSLFRPNGLLFALAALSPTVPMLDRLLPARRFEWHKPADGAVRKTKGEHDENEVRSGAGLPVPGAVH